MLNTVSIQLFHVKKVHGRCLDCSAEIEVYSDTIVAIIILAILSFLIVPSAAKADQGRPVTTQDLIGKTYCWENGGKGTYGAGGSFSNNRGYHGTWSVTEPGVVLVGSRYNQIDILPDGRLQQHVSRRKNTKPGGNDYYVTATPCN